MARNSYEWFQFYFRDWLESERVRNMSLNAQGLYVRLLCTQAIYGSIPSDTEALSLAVNVRHSDFISAWPEVEIHFSAEDSDTGKRLFNNRLRSEIEAKQNLSKLRSKARTKVEQKSDKKAVRARARSYSNSYSKSNSLLEDSFSILWTVYPNRKSKANALKAWLGLSPDAALIETIVEHVKKRAVADPQWLRDGGQYVPMCATFINQRRWEDEYNTAFTTPPRGNKTYSPTEREGFIKYDPDAAKLLTEEQRLAHQQMTKELDY